MQHCVVQHHVTNPNLSTHMATQHGDIHAAIPLRSEKGKELHTHEQPLVAEHKGGRQHSCSHSTAICNEEFTKRLDLQYVHMNNHLFLLLSDAQSQITFHCSLLICAVKSHAALHCSLLLCAARSYAAVMCVSQHPSLQSTVLQCKVSHRPSLQSIIMCCKVSHRPSLQSIVI